MQEGAASFVARPAAISVSPGETSDIATCIPATPTLLHTRNGECEYRLLNAQVDGNMADR